MAVQIEKETFTPYRLCLDEIVAGNTPIHRPDFGEFESLVMQLQKQDAPNVRATMLQTMLETSPGLAALYHGTSSQEDEEFDSHFLEFKDLATLPKPKWLIYDVLSSKGINYLVSEPKKGKTYVAISMACSVAMELPGDRAIAAMMEAENTLNWCGQVTEHGHVLYIAAEAIEDIAERVTGWAKYHGVPDIPYLHLYECPIQLATDTERLMRALDRRYKDADFKLIVVDTQAMCTIGLEENSKKDFDPVVAATEALWRKYNCCILIVHHAGRNGHIRGSSAMDGATYTLLEVSPVDEHLVLKCLLKRLGKNWESDMYLDWKTVEMDYLNQKGEPATTSVVVKSDWKAESDAERLSAFQQKVLDVIQTLGGKDVPRIAVMQEMGIKKGAAEESNLKNATKALITKKLMKSGKLGRNVSYTLQGVEGSSDEFE
jgi:hypothetical protein